LLLTPPGLAGGILGPKCTPPALAAAPILSAEKYSVMNYSGVKEVGEMFERRVARRDVAGGGARPGARRPRIIRQRGAAGVFEAVYSQIYRLIVLVVPVR
jgi:hypothetical protein